MTYFNLDKNAFKIVLKKNMTTLGLTLTEDVAEEISESCFDHITQTASFGDYPATKDFHFYCGFEKRFVTITVNEYLFDTVLNLDFAHSKEQEGEFVKLFSYKLFANTCFISTPERIVHELSKIYYFTHKEVIASAFFEAVTKGEGTLRNHLGEDACLSYDNNVFQLKDASIGVLRLHYLPYSYSLLGISPTLRLYLNIDRVYRANERKLPKHRAYEPSDVIDMLNDMYYYFEINPLDGIALLKGLIDENESTYEKITARVDNTSTPAIEVLREGYNPRRKYTRYPINKDIINDIISR